MSESTNEPASSTDALRDRARAVGLDRVAEAIAASARVSLLLIASSDEHDSFLGAPPTVPAEFSWPFFDAQPLACVACVALARLPRVDGSATLPTAGSLLFFADLRREGPLPENQDLPLAGGAAAVIHVAGTASDWTEPSPFTPTGLGVTFAPRLGIPGHERAARALDLTSEEQSAFRRLWAGQELRSFALHRVDEFGQTSDFLFGWPRWVHPGEPDTEPDGLLLQTSPVDSEGLAYLGCAELYYLLPQPTGASAELSTVTVAVQW